jgi:hypothetical protein
MCTYIYVLNIPIFCAIWLKKCDFLTEKLGIKPDPDPKWFIPDPDPAKSSGSDWIRIRLRTRIHNTAIWAKPFPNKNTLYSNLDFPYGLLVPAKHPALESGQRVQIWKLEILLLILFFRRCLDLQFLVRSLLIPNLDKYGSGSWT